jgi:hypothetical protein
MDPRSPPSADPALAEDTLRDAIESARSHAVLHAGRLGIYAAMGASAGAVPLPWIPDVLARRVRGALVHDIAVRHGRSLESDAREALADPAGPNGQSGMIGQALRFLGAKLATRALTGLGPVVLFRPLRAALHTYVLGHLFDRYLERAGTPRHGRISVDEARRVRVAIDRALLRALTVDVDPLAAPTDADDARDETTAFIDGVLGVAAGVPERLMQRLDAAFDDIVAHETR